MKTNTKLVKDRIKRHIKSFINIKDLKSQIKAVKYGNMSDSEAIDYIIQGGQFLIYYYDVKNFLNRLGINPDNKVYSDNKSWQLYKNLIIINAMELINK